MPAPAFPDALGHANLLDCHHNLHGVQAVKTEVVGEVRGGGELHKLLATSFAAGDCDYRTFEGSETCKCVC